MRQKILPAHLLVLAAAGCAPMTITATVLPTPEPLNCSANGTVQPAKVDTATEIYIYLPPCYTEQPGRSYPTLYIFPGFGGADSDFFAMGVNRTADEMILLGEIPPFIIVAAGDPFPDIDAAGFVEKVLPYVDANLRTKPDPKYRAVAGGSFGGAVAYHLAFRRYDLFGRAGIFGNGAGMGEESDIRGWLDAIPAGMKPRVFINVGENDTYMYERAHVLIPILDEAGIEHAEIFSAGGHSGEYWVSNFPAFFTWLSKDWK